MREVIDELIEHQQKVMLALACQIIPHLTLDDLMQPNDFPLLENNPFFRYEEGVLHGLQMAKARLLSRMQLPLE